MKNPTIIIEGPVRSCASEYGYGDYYLAIIRPDGVDFEMAFCCIPKGGALTANQRRSLRARALRTWNKM
jgi:hypothetical protein